MRVETYQIRDFEDLETGLVVAENDQWILIKYIPFEFILDGYKLLNKAFLEERIREENEILIEKVLTLREIQEDKPDTFQFDHPIQMLSWSEWKYGLFEFTYDDEDDVIYGELKEQDNEGRFYIDFINSYGEREKNFDYQFNSSEIRIITFETDYFEAIRLLTKDKDNA